MSNFLALIYHKVKSLSWGIGLCLIASYAMATSDPNDPMYKNSSLLQYEAFISQSGSVPVDNCLTSGKIIWDASELDQTFIPGTITADSKPPPAGGATTSRISTGATIAGVAATAFALGAPATLIFLGAEILVMLDLCTNVYVVAPHEYYNQIAGKKCVANNGVVNYLDQEFLTSTDVPFFYHCNPTYDPIAGRHLTPGNDKDAAVIGRTYGYMGGASQYCTGKLAQYGDDAEKNNLVAHIVVESASGRILVFRNNSFIAGYNSDCSSDSKRWRKTFRAGQEQYVFPAFLYSYYKMFNETGKIQMCVASTRTMFSIRVACGTIAPPGDENVVDPFLKAYVSDTRCAYLLQTRDDLASLGKSLSDTDQAGNSRKSVKLFLQSDFHFTSTIVGCLKDMLFKIFIKTPGSSSSSISPIFNNEKSFFQKVQERLKQIVLAVLVLYVALSGLKIMTSPEPPKRPELILMIIKFAFVIYFATGDALYRVEPNGHVTGLVPGLLDSMDELSNMFLAAQNNNEPLGLCNYAYNNKNLLGENLYQSGGVINTIGQKGVKLTVWDLVDCKLINYLNMGSCDYTVSGLAMAWLGSVAIWVSSIGLLLAVVSFLYCFMILLVIFKFAHITILALITVTVLLFLAPIFIPFLLFEATKGIYQKWLTTILGYLIYPALLFAFLAIMIATLDKVYYGNLKIEPSGGGSVNLSVACKDVDSIYCYLMGNMVANSSDACDLSPGTLTTKMLTMKSIQYIGAKPSLKEDFASGLLPLVLKLMLFVFLFYMFVGSVTQFLAALLGVQDIGAYAHGALNLGNLLNVLGAGAVTAAGKALGVMKKKN